MTGDPLQSLRVETPEDGYALAMALARRAVKLTQPDADVRAALRGAYDTDAQALIAASHVVAVHFQTVAAANGYWRNAWDGRVGVSGSDHPLA